MDATDRAVEADAHRSVVVDELVFVAEQRCRRSCHRRRTAPAHRWPLIGAARKPLSPPLGRCRDTPATTRRRDVRLAGEGAALARLSLLAVAVAGIFALPVVAARYQQVRVWHPQIDPTNLTEPVRFWELVEWRPMNETTTTTATTTTTTPTTTVPWEPPTTVEMCDDTDPEILVQRMKDSGVYNEIYMAPDFYTASRTFPDLGGKKFMRPKSKYTCDEHCEKSSRLVRLVMTGEERDLPPDPARTWWDHAKWESTRRKRSIADGSTRREELERTIKNALRELEKMDEQDDRPPHFMEDGKDFSDSYSEFFSSRLGEHRREKRSFSELISRNSGISRDVLGTTIALECNDRHEEGTKAGFHFCSSCRAVRHLPKNYFPRIVNEVICGDASCVRGDGRCAQRFLPLKVLHNLGTEACPRWRLATIDIRTCCDCVVHPYSPFVRYLQQGFQ